MSGLLVAIYNPVCGDRTAKAFSEEHVLPLLSARGKTANKVIETESPEHAGQALLDAIQEVDAVEVTVVLASGDGTLHDIINHLANSGGTLPKINFAIIPCGTANALFSSLFPESATSAEPTARLQSVLAYLDEKQPKTLGLAAASVFPSSRSGTDGERRTLSAVVTSTALHASILHDSEALRKEIPGIERFKVAADRNSRKWYKGSVKLFPVHGEEAVQFYQPVLGTFVPHPDYSKGDGALNLEGPFSYFLSTVNVDRLEPAFCISPLASKIPSGNSSCEVVILRPMRDPEITADSAESRSVYVPKLWAAMGGAYQQGSHVDLKYGEAGKVQSEGEGLPVVEYLRCGGWEWKPDENDESSHLLCSDGEIIQVQLGGKVICTTHGHGYDDKFAVYC
ncbi:hypothetical protein BDN72DRAFT_928065 [Pluteus cervinus]|uniref:Uncharacterized protein n=1 Tax=Pluteus cervinus TaxID=181527 RepID=A0ACD3B4K2_9AGAR|nr:hypothetical protein BDN72DRAFT_928065 [Pluteus cervinus]